MLDMVTTRRWAASHFAREVRRSQRLIAVHIEPASKALRGELLCLCHRSALVVGIWKDVALIQAREKIRRIVFAHGAGTFMRLG